MAVIIKHTDDAHGLALPLYWRLNSFDQLPNRQPDGALSQPAVARFRSYASQAAFAAGKRFLSELTVEFLPATIGADMASAAYDAFLARDPSVATAERLKTLADAQQLASEHLDRCRTMLAEAQSDERKPMLVPDDTDTPEEAEERARKYEGAVRRYHAHIAEMEDAVKAALAALDETHATMLALEREHEAALTARAEIVAAAAA